MAIKDDQFSALTTGFDAVQAIGDGPDMKVVVA